MNGLPYYKAYPRDFIEGTIGMRGELKGAYRVLLDLIYMQDGQLPDDPHYISGLLGYSVRKWKSLRQELIDAGKIEAENGIISQFRADKELEITRSYRDQQAENRRGSNKNKKLRKPPSNHTEPESDTPPTDVGGGSAQKRASRLPDDWVLPIEWGRWALGEGWPELVIRSEAEKFRDYWHSASGQSSRKHDWFATWRNWMRKVPKQERGNGKRTLRDRVQRAAERHGELDRGEGGGGDVLRLPARFG